MASQGPTTCDSGDGDAWTNSQYFASTSNANYASAATTFAVGYALWNAGDFSLDPLASVLGIQIQIEAQASDSSAIGLGGNYSGPGGYANLTPSQRVISPTTTSWASYSAGSSSDLWGGIPTVRLVNGAFFAVVYSGTGNADVYQVQATVYYTPGASLAWLGDSANDFMSMPVAILSKWVVAPTTFKALPRRLRDWLSHQAVDREQLREELVGLRRVANGWLPVLAQRREANG